jgi:hypothetical protein
MDPSDSFGPAYYYGRGLEIFSHAGTNYAVIKDDSGGGVDNSCCTGIDFQPLLSSPGIL